MLRNLSVLFLFAVLSCQNTPGIVDRLAESYFPLNTGNTWVYQTRNGTLYNAKVVADSVVEGDTLRFYEFLGEVQRFLASREVVMRWAQTQVFHLGTSVLLENRWQKYLELPPVAGNSWQDTYENLSVLYNDTLHLVHVLTGQVGTPQEIEVPAGTYEAYPVEILEVRTLEGPQPQRDSVWLRLDLAPGVGPVRILRLEWENGGFEADTFWLVAFQEGA